MTSDRMKANIDSQRVTHKKTSLDQALDVTGSQGTSS
jgi:hypothetical protein